MGVASGPETFSWEVGNYAFPLYSASVVLFQLHGGWVSHIQALATPLTVQNTWILTTESISVLAACSSLVSVLFREAISHPYISFFHLLVNGFSVTCFRTFFS